MRRVATLGILCALLAAAALSGRTEAARWVAVFWDPMDYNTGWRVSLSGDSQYGMCAGTPNGNAYQQSVWWNGSLNLVQNSGVYNPGTGRIEWYTDAVVGRDGVFSGVPSGYGWAFEVRMNFVSMWGYGTELGAGTGSIWSMPDGHRWCIGEPGNPDQIGWHNLWSVGCNEVNCPTVSVLGSQIYAPAGCSGCSSGWFTFRLEVDPSGAWRAYIDRGSGFSRIGAGTGLSRPNIVFLGSAFKLPWMGKWTDIAVDYMKVEVQPAGSLSMPANISRAEGPVGVWLSGADPMGRLSQAVLYRSPTGYESWAGRGSLGLSGSSGSGTVGYDPTQDPRGTYYFVVNVYTNDGGACTGNAWSSGNTLYNYPLPLGWVACGGSAYQVVRLWDSIAFTGRVARLGDGAGLGGVRVDECLDGWNCIRSAWTDSGGYFTLVETRPWYYQGYSYVHLIVRPPAGYQAWSSGPGSWPGWAQQPDRIIYPVGQLAEGTTYGSNSFTLAWPVTFTGRVYNRATGAGMGGVTVRLYLNGWSLWAETSTDGAGNYSLTRYDWPPPSSWTFVDVAVLPPANWTAAQAGPGTPPGQVVSASAIRYPTWASGGTTYPNNNFGLDGVYAFSGKVTRLADGVGVPGAAVALIREDTGQTLASTSTASDGSYTLSFQGYPTFNLLVRVYPPPYYSAYSASSGSGGAVLSADTIRFGAGLPPGSYGQNNFVLKARAVFSGTVSRRADGAPVSGATVQFWSGSTLLAGVTTDAGGNYTWTYDSWPPAQPLDIKVVPPQYYAAYQAQIQPPNCCGSVVDASTIRYPTSTPPGAYTGNNFVLGGQLILSGWVRRYWDGKGVAGATVQLIIGGNLAASAVTGADGSYTLSYNNWPQSAGADIVLVVPGGYLAYQASAPPPGQVVDARTIRYPGTAPPGSYPNNNFALTVPPPPAPSGTVSGGTCPQPCLVLMGGSLNPPSIGLTVTVNIPAGRDDITRVELELDHIDPADGRTLSYSLPVSAGQTQVTFSRPTTADQTFGEKALGTWTVKARLVSAAAGPGDWATLGTYTVFWLPARITGP